MNDINIKETQEWYAKELELSVDEFDDYDIHVCQVANDYANTVTSNNSKTMSCDVLFAAVIPSGKDWGNFMISSSILETKTGATAYEAGFKDCIIEIKKRVREYKRNNR